MVFEKCCGFNAGQSNRPKAAAVESNQTVTRVQRPLLVDKFIHTFIQVNYGLLTHRKFKGKNFRL